MKYCAFRSLTKGSPCYRCGEPLDKDYPTGIVRLCSKANVPLAGEASYGATSGGCDCMPPDEILNAHNKPNN